MNPDGLAYGARGCLAPAPWQAALTRPVTDQIVADPAALLGTERQHRDHGKIRDRAVMMLPMARSRVQTPKCVGWEAVSGAAHVLLDHGTGRKRVRLDAT